MGTIFLPRALSALGQSTIEMGPAAVLTQLVSPEDAKYRKHQNHNAQKTLKQQAWT